MGGWRGKEARSEPLHRPAPCEAKKIYALCSQVTTDI